MATVRTSHIKPYNFNTLNAALNPVYQLLVLLGAHDILHVSRIRVNPYSIKTFFTKICNNRNAHNRKFVLMSSANTQERDEIRPTGTDYISVAIKVP
jgi:hypothetical protein